MRNRVGLERIESKMFFSDGTLAEVTFSSEGSVADGEHLAKQNTVDVRAAIDAALVDGDHWATGEPIIAGQVWRYEFTVLREGGLIANRMLFDATIEPELDDPREFHPTVGVSTLHDMLSMWREVDPSRRGFHFPETDRDDDDCVVAFSTGAVGGRMVMESWRTHTDEAARWSLTRLIDGSLLPTDSYSLERAT